MTVEPATPPTEPQRPRTRALAILSPCLVAFVAIHAALVDYFMPVRAVFSTHPLQGVDYDLHIGQVYRIVDALSQWGRTWAYDVQLLAGQPEGTITDSGNKGWELWTFLLQSLGLPRAIAFNTFALAVMLSAPVLVGLAAMSLRMSRAASLTAAALASTLWFFDSHLHWVWFIGMISWSGASCLAMLTLALFHRFVTAPSLRNAAGCGVGLSVGLLIHPYTFFVLAPPMTIMYVSAFRRFRLREHLLVATIGASAIATNAFWLLNAARHWHYILDSAFYAQAKPEYLLCDYLNILCSGADTGVIGTRTGFRFLYLALALAGLVLWRTRRDARFMPVAAYLAPLYAIAYLGEFVPGMQQTQPYRQITPAMLVTTLPAAAFLTEALAPRALEALPAAGKWVLATLGFALVQYLLATQVLYFFPGLVPRPDKLLDGTPSPLSAYGYITHPRVPVHALYRVPHDPGLLEVGWDEIIGWLEQHARPGDRVLVQSPALGERLAWRTKLEVLGGFSERNVEHVDANYFRKHLHDPAKPEEIAHYVRTYAVQWIVTARPEFDRVRAMMSRVATVQDQHIYRTEVPVHRILQGGGQIAAAQNVIRVQGSDPTQPLVLSYHWHEALRCRPNCRVERETSAIDRVGFIRIPAPHPSDVTVWNSYHW